MIENIFIAETIKRTQSLRKIPRARFIIYEVSVTISTSVPTQLNNGWDYNLYMTYHIVFLHVTYIVIIDKHAIRRHTVEKAVKKRYIHQETPVSVSL